MLTEKLKQYRKARGWTQDDLAERSVFSRSSIINWESGKRAPRTVDIDKLAMVLGISTRELINDAPDTTGHGTSKETWPLPFGVGQGNIVVLHIGEGYLIRLFIYLKVKIYNKSR